jgi:outer membrane protein OmpA-like peptidoglycan-associated protein
MTTNQNEKKPRFSLIKKVSAILISLYVVYVIVGLWVVPPLLKPRLEEKLSEQIGRRVTLDQLKLNPFVFSATATNLNIHEKDGEPFAGFEELFVDFQLSSIVKWAVTFKEIRVQAPFGVLKLLPDKKSNIDDILTKFSQPQPAPPPDQKSGLPPAVISKFRVIDGKFTIDDLTGAEAIRQTISPITFSLENLSTLKDRQGAYRLVGVGPNGEQYQLDGQISINPLRIQGSYSARGTELKNLWSHIKDQVSFRIAKGTTGSSGDYSLEFIDGKLNATLRNGEFEINDFQLTERGNEKVLIALPSFSAHGIGADLMNREIVIEGVKTADARIESWLAPDGTFKLQSLLLPDLQKLLGRKSDAPGDAETETTSSSPWHVTINNIEVSNWGFVLEDRTLPEPARVSLDNIGVRVDNLSNKKDTKAEVSMALQVNQAGKISINGSAGIDPLVADLKVVSDRIDLKAFQSYVGTAVNAQIASGTTSSKGRILYKGKSGRPQIRYQGELSLDGLQINDRLQRKDFIKLVQFKSSGIVLDLKPNKLSTAEVLINQPFARITIDRNGTVNVVQAFTPIEKEGQKGKENLLQRLVDFLTLQFEGPMPMDIEMTQLLNLSADFVDESISPPFTTHLEINKGTVNGLSSDPSAQADFTINGTIDQSATIESAGKMNPMNAFQYTQVDFALSDFDLKSVSPYSGKYVGYKIDQGKLQLKLKYLVDKDKIDGKNRIDIDQLTLGEKVESQDATDLPVALGVALLKDASGRISLDVPVAGNVKNPQFDFGKTITSALTKTVENVAKSPFSAVAQIGGFKGEDLRYIEFEPGLSELTAKATKKLDAVARLMNEKPVLTVGVEGTADRKTDGASISGEQSQKGISGDKWRLTKPRQKDLPEENVIDEKQLEQLAQMRARQVQTYLNKQGKIAAKRVQLKPVHIKDASDKDNRRVELFLSVQ